MGPYVVLAGGTQFLLPHHFRNANLLVPLTTWAGPLEFGVRYEILAGCLVDYGGVPDYWSEFLGAVIEELKRDRKILAFCAGSHGRTGCFLGSLIALIESDEETPDPIAAVRKRHCEHAVETLAQAEAIFALRGRTVPIKYQTEFVRPQPVVVQQLQPQGG